ncbi:DUF3987 domain-containing protein [Streptomyces sp. NBC_01751]|uniref:DUF3987 domain-containing protein n=1 Tax=Streptomyces sp. NBC_01751 TaxID=2975929 RepID=UPI002DD7A9A0|nr:DUF3987 domain-containing protein [Streptomyces sp. NBC_01751]WSD24559.1 YfjI family protein [Streptomyces sp. NBC_01751]
MTTFEQMAYGPMGKIVKEAMPTSEADPIGVWAAGLSLYSAAISRTVRLDNRRPVVVWTVLAGRSAIGRKGYALNTATAILGKTKIGGFIHTRRRDGIANGPTLVDTLSKLELETVGQDGGIDGRAIVVEEEWAAVLKDQKRCSKFSTLFRLAWDGKPISNRTKKDGLQSVAQPLLGFHAHITPGEWGKYVSSSEALGGSYNRLLPVLVERSKMLPYNNKPKVPDTAAIQEAFEWATEESRVMSFTREAGERYDEIRAEVEAKMAELPELLASYMERAAEQVQRVAAVLAATEMSEDISKEAVEAAWAFVSYSMASVEKLVKDAATDGGSPKPMKSPEELIRDVLKRHGGDAPSSALLRALWGRMNAAGIKDAVADMDDVEMITEKSKGRGAPKTIYRLLGHEDQGQGEKKPDPEFKVIELKPKAKLVQVNANPFVGLL